MRKTHLKFNLSSLQLQTATLQVVNCHFTVNCQFTSCKLPVYWCKLPIYSRLHTGKLHDHDGVWATALQVVNSHFTVNCHFTSCKLPVYRCKPPVYSGLHTGKLHDHGGVWVLDLKIILKLPVNQQFTVKLWFRICKVVVYSKAAVYNL